MKILVAVKRVADPNVRVSVAANGTGVDLANVRMAMNPFDEIAVEEAVRLRESGAASEVTAVSIGGPKCQDTLRSAVTSVKPGKYLAPNWDGPRPRLPPTSPPQTEC